MRRSRSASALQISAQSSSYLAGSVSAIAWPTRLSSLASDSASEPTTECLLLLTATGQTVATIFCNFDQRLESQPNTHRAGHEAQPFCLLEKVEAQFLIVDGRDREPRMNDNLSEAISGLCLVDPALGFDLHVHEVEMSTSGNHPYSAGSRSARASTARSNLPGGCRRRAFSSARPLGRTGSWASCREFVRSCGSG